MDYFDNGSFMNQLDTQNQVEKKNNINMGLLIALLITTSSTIYFYVKMEEYKAALLNKPNIS